MLSALLCVCRAEREHSAAKAAILTREEGGSGMAATPAHPQVDRRRMGGVPAHQKTAVQGQVPAQSFFEMMYASRRLPLQGRVEL